MSDSHDAPNMPGFDSAAGGMSAMTKSMQSLASEMQRMSKDTMDQTTQAMEKMRGAKSMEDVVAIQTSFMQTSFSNYAAFTQRFSELMMSVPMELAKHGRTAMQQGTDAMTKVGEQASQQMRQATHD